MNIIEKPLQDIYPYENNPRINDNAIDKVMESIKRFGFKVPIVVDKDNIIVAGHTRYKASKKLGLETVPCIVADDLTDEQIKAFRLADNKVSEFATWDDDRLIAELDTLIDMDMDVFGFDASHIEDIEPIERNEMNVADTYEVIVSCNDESHLEETYNRLIDEGYSCRISTL